ncbi:E3 ubiquitin/ISG15 ligase TRIM25-like [Eleutherodactylus coqui]|uniref:E3 ubiquitin/ISG15 ligase TRIM25-like n=1 Tax=Eleutherodactylus coqui TaxID=57060 RepID=UPI00346186A5
MATCELKEELSCPICLNIYTDPVTLRCGHSFCRGCIDSALNAQEGGNSYTCPNCRKKFSNRPLFQKNIALRNITERFQSSPNIKARLQIFCTYCILSPVPAVKHCGMCEASLCDDHLMVHSKSPEHALSELSTSVGIRACPIHREVLQYYCIEDATCICSTCMLAEEHLGHQFKPLVEASEKKKENLKKVLEKLNSKNDEAKKKIQHLKQRRNAMHHKASAVIKRVTTLFSDIKKQGANLEMKIVKDISGKRDLASLPVSDQILLLEMQKEELSRKIRHTEDLCDMTDALTVLQEQETDNDNFCDTMGSARDEEQIYDGGPPDQDFISATLYPKLLEILVGISKWFSMHAPMKILLDVNTAANNIHVSRRLKFASWSGRNQKRPDTPGRFQNRQVISLGGMSSGRHYWDVEVGDHGHWRIGMCYSSIERNGDRSYIGNNNVSWCVCRLIGNQDSVMHNDEETFLPCKVSSKKLRIWVDYEAGQMSFFDLGEPVRHLHTFTTTFTEPLHAAFYISKDWFSKDWIRISD